MTTPPNPATDAAPTARRRGIQHALTVVRTEQLTPHLVRVHLGGDGFDAYIADADTARLDATDTYSKLLFAKLELGLTPPYDLEKLRETLPFEDLPVRRTYTIRSINEAEKTIAIDFVVHGSDGIAGPWAAAAQPGDIVSLSSPGGQFTPSQDASVQRLILGDDSAIPAIAAALEAMPEDAVGRAIIEVGDANDEITLMHPAGVEVTWLHRAGAEHGIPLVEAARALPKPKSTDNPDAAIEVFAHGERAAMKQLRRLLHTEWGIDRRALSLSAYWALGRAEDGFQAEKREPVGKIFDE
ncbi:siderophore-interacting protein [Paramicrobacterium fandaimingii]|uniref:siderophore-interacting protein n=1 Tax=Paramicrobacterium fandaimingii TaxID=2708079 RepID=UPI001421386C|nr:siderophore-interacting protein [Microbacterium fandaimingii]